MTFGQSWLDLGQEGLFFIIRIIATIGGAVVGWFAGDLSTRGIYFLWYRASAPGILVFSVKVVVAILLALVIYFFVPLGGGGLGNGPGVGGAPSKGDGKGDGKGDKNAITDSARKDDKATDKDSKTPKVDPEKKPLRQLVIEVLGGDRLPDDGRERYYLIAKAAEPLSITEVKDYFKKSEGTFDTVWIVHTEHTVVVPGPLDPTRRLQKLVGDHGMKWRMESGKTIASPN